MAEHTDQIRFAEHCAALDFAHALGLDEIPSNASTLASAYCIALASASNEAAREAIKQANNYLRARLAAKSIASGVRRIVGEFRKATAEVKKTQRQQRKAERKRKRRGRHG